MQGKLFLRAVPKGSPDDRQLEKAAYPKTRTGCIRCKARRVKCDEEKPACLRCRRLNFDCPGYNPPKARIFGLTQNDCFTCEFDKLCFNSFLTPGDRHMAYFQPSSKKFWWDIAPQLAQVLPAVRHTVIALGIRQEPIRFKEIGQISRSKGFDHKALALKHFNSAIRDFVRASATLSTEAKLTCCVLFTALQTYLEHSVPPAIHILAAQRLLEEYEQAVEKGQQVLDLTIAYVFKPIILRLLIDVAAFQDEFQYGQMRRSDPFEQFASTLFETVIDINDFPAIAEHASMLLKYSIMIHLGDIPPDSPVASRIPAALKTFEGEVLRQYSHNSRSDTSRQKGKTEIQEYDVNVLLLNCRAIWILANTRLGEEGKYDSFTNDFSRILSLGEQAVSMDYAAWQTSLGIIPPLFLVATKCRVHHLRHKALELIHAASNFERAWSSCTGFVLARFLTVLEEQLQQEAASKMERADRVSLRSIRINRVDGTATVRFHICRSNVKQIPVQLIMPPSYVMAEERRKGIGAVTNRIVQVCGFSGTQLHMPCISCHCTKDFLTWNPETAALPKDVLSLNLGDFRKSQIRHDLSVPRESDG